MLGFGHFVFASPAAFVFLFCVQFSSFFGLVVCFNFISFREVFPYNFCFISPLFFFYLSTSCLITLLSCDSRILTRPTISLASFNLLFAKVIRLLSILPAFCSLIGFSSFLSETFHFFTISFLFTFFLFFFPFLYLFFLLSFAFSSFLSSFLFTFLFLFFTFLLDISSFFLIHVIHFLSSFLISHFLFL